MRALNKARHPILPRITRETHTKRGVFTQSGSFTSFPPSRHVRFAPRADVRPMPAFMSNRPKHSKLSATPSQWQLRFIIAVAARSARGGRRRGMRRKSPAHPRHVARPAVDDQLHGAARTIGPGEIDALLDLDAVPIGAKRPHLPVRRREHRAVPIG